MANFSKMEEKAYRAAPGLNKSLLVPFMRSPAHYLHAVLNPKKTTESMDVGSALHAEVLQPFKAASVYAVCRKVDRRKTADKEYLAEFELEHAGKIIIDEDQKKVVDGMNKAIMSHPMASRLVKGATHLEQALFGTYKSKSGDYSVDLKGMADGLSTSEPFMFDIKTTENASPSEFAKKVRAFRYDLQQVHYSYLGATNGVPPGPFYFVVVENVEPYGVAVYTLDPKRVERVWDEWSLALDFFAHCHAKQDFNISYPDASSELQF